jgi:hypothetical protein
VTGAKTQPFTARARFCETSRSACSSALKVTLSDLRRSSALGTRSVVIALTVTVLRSQECGSSQRVLDGVELGLHEVDVSALHFDVVPLAVNLALLFLDKTSLLFKFCGDAPFHPVLLRMRFKRAQSTRDDGARMANARYRSHAQPCCSLLNTLASDGITRLNASRLRAATRNGEVGYHRVVMIFMSAALTVALAASAGERAALIVSGPEPPARLAHATVITPAEGPPVVLYAATNATDQSLDQFTVMAFVFKADGTLKARQVAPGRRTLEPRETKYSTLVLDGGPIDPTDVIVVGIDQVQRAGSDDWWRTDLQPAAEAAVPRKQP